MTGIGEFAAIPVSADEGQRLTEADVHDFRDATALNEREWTKGDEQLCITPRRETYRQRRGQIEQQTWQRIGNLNSRLGVPVYLALLDGE